ncbi:MAG: hypothetical protein ACKOU7_05260 [Ferruginibacter sp.]
MKTCFLYFLVLFAGTASILSCQKELNGFSDGTTNPVPADEKPRVGTIWTYSYYTYYAYPGGVRDIKTVHHKAKEEVTLGGEKWLNIIDMDGDTTVYYLNTKVDGLYQYTNSNPYLLCKYPAAVNDTYNTYNNGSTEFFTVRGVNDTTSTNIGDIPLSKYEGVKNGDIIDLIWYNKNAWLVWRWEYRRTTGPTTFIYYLSSKLFLTNIVY